jgi:glycosyltransferase involved in cell wall biosynthesis
MTLDPISPWRPIALAERLRESLQQRDDRASLRRARGGRDVCWLSDEAEPLVTIRITTYNRAQLLAERALASALRQTYERLEVLVVGDGTDAETDRMMAGVNDPRVRYVNLRRMAPAVPDGHAYWATLGIRAMNAAIVLARGEWLAPLDDDDEFTDDHCEVLLHEAQRRRLEFVYSVSELTPGGRSIGAWPMRAAGLTHGSVLYSMGLGFMTYNPNCWRRGEPQDWNLFRRIKEIGTSIGFLDAVTYRYYVREPT